MVTQFILKGFVMPDKAKEARKAKDDKRFQKEVSKVDRAFNIYLRYTHGEKSFFLKTEKRIKPVDWDFKGQKPAKKQRNFEAYLTNFKKNVDEIATSLHNDQQEPTIEAVKKKYLESTGKVQKQKETLMTLWKAYNRFRQSRVAYKTFMSEKASMETFEAFLDKKKKDDLKPYELSQEWINKYVDYLNEKYIVNTSAKKLKHFKQFLTYLQDAEDQKFNNPSLLKRIKYKEVQPSKVWLTESEVLQLQAYDFGDDKILSQCRDLFLLQCRTALRVSDLQRISKAHINNGFISIQQQKTKKTVKIFITDEIKTILERYDYNIPIPANRKWEPIYNLNIKEVARKAIPESEIEILVFKPGKEGKLEIVKKADILTSHDAIRTCITLRDQKGMPVAQNAQASGKTVAVLLKSYLGNDDSEERIKKDASAYEFAKPMAISA